MSDQSRAKPLAPPFCGGAEKEDVVVSLILFDGLGLASGSKARYFIEDALEHEEPVLASLLKEKVKGERETCITAAQANRPKQWHHFHQQGQSQTIQLSARRQKNAARFPIVNFFKRGSIGSRHGKDTVEEMGPVSGTLCGWQ